MVLNMGKYCISINVSFNVDMNVLFHRALNTDIGHITMTLVYFFYRALSIDVGAIIHQAFASGINVLY